MKKRKSKPDWTKYREGLGRKNQAIITKIRSRYTTTTHRHIIDQRDNTDCPFCEIKLTVKHILWTCKETEQDRIRLNITKDVWSKRREGMLKLIEYQKRIGLYNGI
jgi:hypothetical protein